MAIEGIASSAVSSLPLQSPKGGTEQVTESADTFASMFDKMSEVQNNAENSAYKMVTTGEGNTSDVLIQMKKAESQMKTAAVIRDNLVESYKQLLNTQV